MRPSSLKCGLAIGPPASGSARNGPTSRKSARERRRGSAMTSKLRMALAGGALALAACAPEPSVPAPQGTIQLGPRPLFLVDDMDPGPLKERLLQCAAGPFAKTDFSIAHRGAPLQL